MFGASLPESTLNLFPSALHTLHVLYTRAVSRGGKYEQINLLCLKTNLLLFYDVICDLVCVFLNFLPPQRHHIGDRSLSLCNMFLDEMAKQARNLITDICTEQCTLSDQVLTYLSS